MAKQTVSIDDLDADAQRTVLSNFQQTGDVPFLHAAARLGNFEAVAEYLADPSSAGVNVRDPGQRTMAHVAVRRPGASCTALLKVYRNHRGDLDAQANGGLSILHVAAFWKNHEAVRQLLEAGANPDLRNLQGETPLMVALAHDDLESAQALLDFNADPTLVNARGQTALDICTSLDAMQIVQRALGAGTMRLPGL